MNKNIAYTITETEDTKKVDSFSHPSQLVVEEFKTFEDAKENALENIENTGAIYTTVTSRTLGELLDRELGTTSIMEEFYDTTSPSPVEFIEEVATCILGYKGENETLRNDIEELEMYQLPKCKTSDQQLELDDLLESFKRKHFL